MTEENEISKIILDELRAHRSESNERHVQIDNRVRRVEDWQSNANGKISIIGAVGVGIGGFIAWVGDFFRQ